MPSKALEIRILPKKNNNKEIRHGFFNIILANLYAYGGCGRFIIVEVVDTCSRGWDINYNVKCGGCE